MHSTTASFLSFLALAPLLTFIPTVSAGGTIACYSTHLAGGVGNIPAHNPEFFDGTDTYIGGPFNLACGEMVGHGDDGYSNWEGGGGRSISANFWITPDSCMNVETGGNHYWCCPGRINQNDGSVTSCDFS
ncbi:hypothetical protein C8Q70DRAFT_934672 [Cubamyces menziesii]|uniref:Uncharacterized protein n=1 Tax=Trametes cubensis TaxID=1111947 RepID=A0AAD7X6L5_9APHY|nr:hypothetical protein C8Q70DRAFT_934672 [Cubamyces menziesii]KAJ8454915.1 hypothetical protein ONZ51_g12752 [Trametes cubensis]